MASYSTNQFKNGLKLLIDGEPCSIVSNESVKPGKGQAFNRVKLRFLKTGRVVERTFKSGESVEAADVVDRDMQYSYNDGSDWYFMDQETFEQIPAGETALADAKQWIKENDICQVTLYNGNPISVTPPNFVELTVTETEPSIKGDTVSGGNKAATLETGASVRVPMFINEGDVLKIDTRNGEYVSRA